MEMTTKIYTARAKVRKEGTKRCGYLDLLFAGEHAYKAGRPLQSNPHTDAKDAATWRDGWLDAMEQTNKN
jgi:ferric-dicitrate binding protein FerR (iron transport regulator)